MLSFCNDYYVNMSFLLNFSLLNNCFVNIGLHIFEMYNINDIPLSNKYIPYLTEENFNSQTYG